MLERNLKRLHAAHRQAGHRPMVAVGDRAIGGVDHRNQVADHHLFKRAELPAEIEAQDSAPARPCAADLTAQPARQADVRITLFHDNQHRLRLSRGQEIVEDEADPSLVRPAGLVLAAAMLQVEHRVARVAIGVVARRRVNEDPPLLVRRLREVPALADLAVRHVLRRVEIDTLLRDLDAAGVFAGAVETIAGGVGDLRPVDEHSIVMEPRHLRVRRRSPKTVVAFLSPDSAWV